MVHLISNEPGSCDSIYNVPPTLFALRLAARMGSQCSKARSEETGSFLSGLDEDMSVLSKLQQQLETEIEDTEKFKEENDKLMSERVRELLRSIDDITSMEEKGVVVRQIDSDIERLPRVPTPFIARQRQREYQLEELRVGLQRTEVRFNNSNLRLNKKLSALNAIVLSHSDQTMDAAVLMQAVARGVITRLRLKLNQIRHAKATIAIAAVISSFAANDATAASAMAFSSVDVVKASLSAIRMAAEAADSASAFAIEAITSSRAAAQESKAGRYGTFSPTKTDTATATSADKFNIFVDESNAAQDAESAKRQKQMREIEELEKSARERLMAKKLQRKLEKKEQAQKKMDSATLSAMQRGSVKAKKLPTSTIGRVPLGNRANNGVASPDHMLNISNGQQLADFLATPKVSGISSSSRPPMAPSSGMGVRGLPNHPSGSLSPNMNMNMETSSQHSSSSSVLSTGSRLSQTSRSSVGSSISRASRSSAGSLRSSNLGCLLLHSQKVSDQKKLRRTKKSMSSSGSSSGKPVKSKRTKEERESRRAAKQKLAEYQAKLAQQPQVSSLQGLQAGGGRLR